MSFSLTTDPRLRWKCLLALDKVCATYGILPERYPRINNVVVFGDSPEFYGGSADVWRGEVDHHLVAVKVTRRYSTVPISQAQEVRSTPGGSFEFVLSLIFGGSAILPGSSRLGKVISSEYLTFPWGRYKNISPGSNISVDGTRKPERVSRLLPKLLQAKIGESTPHPSNVIHLTLHSDAWRL